MCQYYHLGDIAPARGADMSNWGLFTKWRRANFGKIFDLAYHVCRDRNLTLSCLMQICDFPKELDVGAGSCRSQIRHRFH